jgi:hypothetical protein
MENNENNKINENIITNYKQSSIYKWRNNKTDKYKILSRKYSLDYYYKNKNLILEKQKRRYNELKGI